MKTIISLIGLSLAACGAIESKKKTENIADDTRGEPTSRVTRGPVGPAGSPGKDALPCTVADVPEGVLVTCGESSVVVKHGAMGPQGSVGAAGQTGSAGKDGESIVGPSGPQGAVGATGESIVGPQGETGAAGKDGESITGPKGDKGNPGETVVGPQGPQGPAGADGKSIKGDKGDPGSDGKDAPVLKPIDPCGDDPKVIDEVLFEYNGMVFAAFSDDANGKNTRLSVLPDNTYMTTDGSKCIFTIKDGTVIQ